jgi:hypothetical protein
VGVSPLLENLCLYDTSVTDEGLVAALSGLKYLEVLILGRGKFDGSVLEKVATLSKLRQLFLHYLKITDEDIHCLQALKTLERLDFTGCEILSYAAIDELRQALPGCQIGDP